MSSSGTVQVTDRVVVGFVESGETSGVSGASGGSFTSVMVMVTTIVSLALSGSLALTVTEYEDLDSWS